jgi:hypothetical protein
MKRRRAVRLRSAIVMREPSAVNRRDADVRNTGNRVPEAGARRVS